MKSVKNSSIGVNEGGGRGPPTMFDDGRKKRSVNLWREWEREREREREQTHVKVSNGYEAYNC